MAQLNGRQVRVALLFVVLAVALAACGGHRRATTATTTVRTTTVCDPALGCNPAAAGEVASDAQPLTQSADRRAGSAAAPQSTLDPLQNPRMAVAVIGTSAAILGQATGDAFGVGASAAAGGSAVAGGADGQQCQNPFGSQNAGNGQFLCSDKAERLTCQCDVNGCQLVPTGILACVPTGGVFQ